MVSFRVSSGVKILTMVLQWWDLGRFGRSPADFPRSGSFFPDAISFSSQFLKNLYRLVSANCFLRQSHSAAWIQLLTNVARIPMRLTMFARRWLMLWCGPNRWKCLYYLPSGSPSLITSAKCFGMLMMCSPRTWGVLQYIPAGWPCLWCPPWGTQLAYGHTFISDATPDSLRLLVWDYTSDGFDTKCKWRL